MKCIKDRFTSVRSVGLNSKWLVNANLVVLILTRANVMNPVHSAVAEENSP